MITPCIGLCRIDPDTQTCKGCKRTRLEVQRWSEMADAERQSIMTRLGYYKRMGREERLRRYDRG